MYSSLSKKGFYCKKHIATRLVPPEKSSNSDRNYSLVQLSSVTTSCGLIFNYMLFQKEIQNKHWEERKTKESKNSEWINWQKNFKDTANCSLDYQLQCVCSEICRHLYGDKTDLKITSGGRVKMAVWEDMEFMSPHNQGACQTLVGRIPKRTGRTGWGD